MVYLFFAYLAIWVLIFIYLVILTVRSLSLERSMKRIEEKLTRT